MLVVARHYILDSECRFVNTYLPFLGQALGNVVAMPITGLICASKYGWPLVFYIYGGLGVAWSIIWMTFGSDNPLKHKSITKGETVWLENVNLHQNNEQVGLPRNWH